MRDTVRPMIAEAIGTFFLVFCGVGAIVSELYRTGTVGFVGIALAHGIALAVGISATMSVSGGHLNPAVTIGLMSVGRTELRKGLLYIVAQLLGGVIAVLAIKGLFPEQAGQIALYGAPRLANDVSNVQGIVIEAIMTFLLAFTVMGTCVDSRSPRLGGWAIGLIVFADILAGGQMTGAAMNPARAFAPMLVTREFTSAGIYWIGPIIGSVLAMQIYERFLLERR
jgi:aquaporin TIP